MDPELRDALTALQAEMRTGFAKVDQRFAQVDQRFDSESSSVAAGFAELRDLINDRFDAAERHARVLVEAVRDETRLLAGQLTRHTERLDDHEDRLKRLER